MLQQAGMSQENSDSVPRMGGIRVSLACVPVSLYLKQISRHANQPFSVEVAMSNVVPKCRVAVAVSRMTSHASTPSQEEE